MSLETLGNLIAVGAILAGSFVISFIMTLLLDEPVKDDYKYCHDCKYGFCTYDPKSNKCLKLSDKKQLFKEEAKSETH